MGGNSVVPGDVLIIKLPTHYPKGREQEGSRPAIAVGIPQGIIRYPVVVVVPLTTQVGFWAKKNPSLYQTIPQGAGGIPQHSIALIDQVRAIDIQRVQAYLGSLEEPTYAPIRNSLLKLLQGEL